MHIMEILDLQDYYYIESFAEFYDEKMTEEEKVKLINDINKWYLERKILTVTRAEFEDEIYAHIDSDTEEIERVLSARTDYYYDIDYDGDRWGETIHIQAYKLKSNLEVKNV